MGGYGSGQWYRYGKKATTDAYPDVDVRAWKRAGRIEPGLTSRLVEWRGGAIRLSSLEVAADESSITIRRHGAIGAIRLRLEWTACNYGGRRPWFVCASCTRRKAKLYEYAGGNGYACRECLSLTYESQREAEHYRLLRKARKKRGALGPTREGGRYPRRPKHMRWKTFVRTLREIQELEAQANAVAHRRLLGGALALLQRLEANG